MTGLCFVDANVFVYLDDPRDTRKRSLATEWLERLWANGQGRTSVQVLCEYFVTATRKLPVPLDAEAAWRNVRGLSAWGPQPIDFDVVTRAFEIHHRYRLNWWDCMIVAAAQLQRCDLLLTEDLHDGAVYGGVTVRNPFSYSVAEAVAAYDAPPRARYARRPSAMRP